MTGSKPNIIFLDIDGVLNTRRHLRRQKAETGKMSSNNWCPIACRHVTLLCEQFGGRIVISSTWRYDHTPEELRYLLKKNDIDPRFLVGITPALIHNEETGSFIRGDEIARWLKDHDYNNSQYVIIDDLPVDRFLKKQHHRLVRVHEPEGFAEKEAAVKAGKILES